MNFLSSGKREVKALRVKCDNVERGCDWEGTVGTLEKHLDPCNITLIPCPKKCKHNDMIRTVMRKDLEKHLVEDCVNRDYECVHCKKKDTFANITETHDNLCKKKVVPCPSIGCTENMERAKLKKHLYRCGYAVVSCKHTRTGCDKKLRRKDMEAHELDYKAHLHRALNSIAKLQHELQSATKDTASMKKELQSTTAKGEDMAVKFESAMKTIASMKEENQSMAIKLKSATKLIKSLKKESEDIASLKKEKEDVESEYLSVKTHLESWTESIKKSFEKLFTVIRHYEAEYATTRDIMRCELGDIAVQLESAQLLQKEGSIIFKLVEYREKMRSDDAFQSRCFYTCIGGYNMYIKVYPNGYGHGEGTHVSVHVCIVKGIYDNILNSLCHWPLLLSIKLELLDQSADANHHLTKLFLYDPHIGKKWDIPRFIPHSKLCTYVGDNTQYLKDDTINLKISVNHWGRLNYHMLHSLVCILILVMLSYFQLVSPSVIAFIICAFLILFFVLDS